eukprot:1161266-Pelagomonas_calceolata.AAC.15
MRWRLWTKYNLEEASSTQGMLAHLSEREHNTKPAAGSRGTWIPREKHAKTQILNCDDRPCNH